MKIRPRHGAVRATLSALLTAAALIATTTFAKESANLPAAYVPDPVTTTSLALSGKLFFTDAKRAQLDRARKSGVQVVNEEVVFRTTTLKGFIKSSDGSATYWINSGRSGDTRYVDGQDRSVSVDSAMVGPASNINLLSANSGADRAAGEARDHPQLSDKPKQTKTKPVKKKVPVQKAGQKQRP